ncbi:MAG: response regulator [Pseudomonadota bacterium]
MKILVAEDSPINQRLMLSMLSNLGHDADVVDNGEAACQAVQSHHYDLVLMDVQMPIMDGLAASRKINEEIPANKRPRIVALTAEASAESQHACRDAGMDDYLAKPIEREELLDILDVSTVKKVNT